MRLNEFADLKNAMLRPPVVRRTFSNSFSSMAPVFA
jgi:hypothetical protein